VRRPDRKRSRLILTLAVVGVIAPALVSVARVPADAARPAPRTSILTGPGDRSPSRVADFTFEADQPNVRYAVRLDSGHWSRWTTKSSARFTALEPGSHAVAVRSEAASGRIGAVETARFVVDLTRPTTSFTGDRRPATVLKPSSALRFSAGEADATFSCKVDAGVYRSCTSPYVLKGLGAGRHKLAVRATDAAGNTDASPAVRTLTLDAAAPPGSLFSDDFESGNLSRWTVTTKGSGTATVQSGTVHAGTYAATFTTTAMSGSAAYARTALSTSVADLTVAAAVRVDAEGASGGDVPLLRLFDASGTRIINLYRQNATGVVWVRYGSTYAKTGAKLPLGVWADVKLRVAGSTLQASMNGASIFSTDSATLTPAKTVLLGNEVSGQAATLDVDDVSLTATGADTVAPDTTITSGPSGPSPGNTASITFTSSETGSFQCSLDGAAYTGCTSPQTLTGLAKGGHMFAVRAIDTAGNVDASPATASWSSAGDTTPALLIADNQNRRILITDYDGKVLWKFDNPTGETSASSGPLGVRWMDNGHILATFGTGKVGEIDPVTKTFVWKVAGFNQDWFASPYDAQFLPDGNLAVATARNGTGRVAVFNPATGALVWKYDVNFARLVELVPAGLGTDTAQPTLLMAGRDKLTEAVYDPGQPDDKTAVWQWAAGSNTHRAILDRDGKSIVLSNWNSFVKVARPSQDLTWSRDQGNTSGEEMRGVAMTSNGYVYGYRIWYGASQVRFADADGNLLRSWSSLSDGTRLNLVWGVRTIQYNG